MDDGAVAVDDLGCGGIGEQHGRGGAVTLAEGNGKPTETGAGAEPPGEGGAVQHQRRAGDEFELFGENRCVGGERVAEDDAENVRRGGEVSLGLDDEGRGGCGVRDVAKGLGAENGAVGGADIEEDVRGFVGPKGTVGGFDAGGRDVPVGEREGQAQVGVGENKRVGGNRHEAGRNGRGRHG